MLITEQQIRERLITEVAAAARVERQKIDVREPFASYDISSIDAVALVGDLERWLAIPLDATLLWDHATIDDLARHLAGLTHDKAARP